MPKTVALEDDSLFILSGYYNGISHPPGYPIYTFIVYLFTHLPVWGGVAAKAHASSAFFGALTIGVFYLLFTLVGLRGIYSILLAVTVAVTSTFWSQAIITEVYSLNCFLNIFALYIALSISLNYQKQSSFIGDYKLFCLLAVVLGLALANHWPLTLLAMPAYLLISYRSFLLQDKKAVIVFLFLVSFLVPYAAMYFNNQSSPEINFSGEFQGFSDLIAFVLRSHYAAVDYKETAGLIDKLFFSKDFIIQIAKELNLLLLFAGVGCYRLYKSVNSRILLFSLIWLFLSNSFVLIGLLNFDYDEYSSLVFRVYPIVSIVGLFVLSAYGLSVVALFSGGANAIKNKISTVIIISMILNITFSLPNNYRNDYVWAEAYGNRILADIPEGATLFADGDIELGVISYLHKVKGVRSDLSIYSPSALLLNNRLYAYDFNDKKGFLDDMVKKKPEENYYVANNYHKLSVVEGSVFSLKLGAVDNKKRITITDEDIQMIVEWSHGKDAGDPWTRLAIKRLRQIVIRAITRAVNDSEDAQQKKHFVEMLNWLVITDSDKLAYLTVLIKNTESFNLEYYAKHLSTIRRNKLKSKQDLAHFIYLSQLTSINNSTDSSKIMARIEACRSWQTANNYYCSSEL